MTTFKNYILAPTTDEAAYPGNIGFEELTNFYQKASDKEIKEMEKLIKKNDWMGFRNMIYKVLGVKLK